VDSALVVAGLAVPCVQGSRSETKSFAGSLRLVAESALMGILQLRAAIENFEGSVQAVAGPAGSWTRRLKPEIWKFVG
jgi:hypothetical protein